MLLELDASQLVLVDYQPRLMPAMHDADAVVANAVRLARMAAILEVPCFATEQNPSKLGETLPELKAALLDAKVRWLAKMQFSAVEEGLGEWLRPPAKPVQGNARSLPKTSSKTRRWRRARNHRSGRLRGPRVSAANRFGSAGR